MSMTIVAACEASWAEHSEDCSGFCRAVAGLLGVMLTGVANDIIDTARTSPDWTVLPDGPAAATAAAAGKFVIAGLRGDEESRTDPHGHVVVIVPGPCARGLYPHAYWGMLGGVGARNQTTNYAWVSPDRDRVTYAACTANAGNTADDAAGVA